MLKVKDFKLINYFDKIEILKNKSLFFAKNGKPIIIYDKWKSNNQYLKLMSSLLFYTRFLKEDKFLLGLRFFCIENNIEKYPKCKCGSDIYKIFRNLYFNKYCSQICANRYTNYKKNIYGKEMSKKIWSTRRKNGKGFLSEDHKKKLSEIHKLKSTQEKMENTCLKRYGVKNPGILGAYFSKAAEKYIKNFIDEKNIDENRCYFRNGGINKKEYFQMIFNEKEKKFKYFSYDLVIFNNKKLQEIETVLEYNGPWHYTKNDIEMDPDGPSTPYKTNKLSKKDVYLKDQLKLNHIKCNNILIYWESNQKLENYEKYN